MPLSVLIEAGLRLLRLSLGWLVTLQIAGFKPNDDAMAGKIAAARPTTPSLFVWGAADQLVPAERSRQLMECFGGKTETFEHVGAHMVRRFHGLWLHLRYSSRVRSTLCCLPDGILIQAVLVCSCLSNLHAGSILHRRFQASACGSSGADAAGHTASRQSVSSVELNDVL